MEMTYRDAMDQLRSMFGGFDEETIKTVLTANDGHVERTIEDLLKMNDENEKHHQNQDDDNLFADSGPKHRTHYNDNLFAEPQHSNYNHEDIFRSTSNNDWHARQQQEKEDAALAYRLQKEYMQQEAHVENPPRSQQRRPQANPYASYSNTNYPSNSNNNYPAGSHMDPNPYAQSNAQFDAQARHEDSKKKPGIMTKMKAGISSLFHRKKGKKQAPTRNPGNYAEIENLEENDVYNLGDDGPVRDTELHQLRGNEYNANRDNDAPMQLSDVLNPHGANALDSDGEDNYAHNQRGYSNYNQNQRLPQENYGYH